MKTLKNKLKKQGGFTLVEMLTVVAIIAILIAISIPMVTGALDRAKKATDAANVRAAKAAMSIESLTNKDYEEGTVKTYNAATGALQDGTTDVTPYKKENNTTTDMIFVMEFKDVVYYQWAATAPTKYTGPDAPTATWKTAVEPNDF